MIPYAIASSHELTSASKLRILLCSMFGFLTWSQHLVNCQRWFLRRMLTRVLRTLIMKSNEVFLYRKTMYLLHWPAFYLYIQDKFSSNVVKTLVNKTVWILTIYILMLPLICTLATLVLCFHVHINNNQRLTDLKYPTPICHKFTCTILLNSSSESLLFASPWASSCTLGKRLL